MKDLLERLPEEDAPSLSHGIDPVTTSAARFAADEAGKDAVMQFMPELVWEDKLQPAKQAEAKPAAVRAGQQLSLPNRWRLILASQPEKLPPMAAKAAKALDELYGQGKGEGLCGRARSGAGQEDAYPGAREWAEDLGEPLAKRSGKKSWAKPWPKAWAGAFAILESEPVKPSMELLEQVLSLKGSLPESQMEKLRRYVRRIVDQLVKELSSKLRPALMGLTTSRPTSRKTPRLDLKRTVRANLHTARKDDQGKMQLVPERFLFKTLSKRSMDWHVIFVVDVSGSMEPSVIFRRDDGRDLFRPARHQRAVSGVQHAGGGLHRPSG